MWICAIDNLDDKHAPMLLRNPLARPREKTKGLSALRCKTLYVDTGLWLVCACDYATEVVALSQCQVLDRCPLEVGTVTCPMSTRLGLGLRQLQIIVNPQLRSGPASPFARPFQDQPVSAANSRQLTADSASVMLEGMHI